jgi:threonine/homoserine/homoserine lactone efflux protein
MFVITQSISHGKRDGIAVSLGLCSGLFVHTFAAAVGISALLYHSALAFQLLKYFGAAYLLYLAWNSLKKTSRMDLGTAVPQESLIALYRRGILMNVLNPKVSLFFLAFLPQFVSAKAGSIPAQMVMLGGLFIFQAIAIFTLVSLFAGMLGEKVVRKTANSKIVNYIQAVVYTVLGIRLAMLEK